MPPSSRRRSRQRPRRDAVLKAAVEVVAEEGISGVTHRAVTQRAGVPLATVSYYFSSIDELISEALHEFVRERVAEMATPLDRDSASTPAELGQWLVSLFRDSSRQQRIAFFEILVNAQRFPELAETARHGLDAYQEGARSALQALGAPSASGDARAFVALCLGYGLLDIADPDTGDSEEFFTALAHLLLGKERARDAPEQAERRIGRALRP
ncbi:TetR family transcriptional regulator [Haloechinothrix sp. LS1_15]|uniref:TetR/AcrR family transcriptional regulator n=1 Tax=Haloechinothrix sp. LS1_15 TaxID=2652248 RepID=UPI00294AD0C9|nr:TetR family transcriptional regulator [Haloechinothrix sp. LS1_15]